MHSPRVDSASLQALQTTQFACGMPQQGVSLRSRLLDTGDVLSVAFSPDGQHIVSASGDCTIFMWHAPTGEVEVASSTGQSESVSSATSPLDGNRIASASRDRTIHVENVNTEDIEKIRFIDNFVHGSNWATVYAHNSCK